MAAFEKQQERDAKKRALCQQNGMTLIEVHPDYVLAHVVTQVFEALSANISAQSRDD
jgi:hypothetical protein